ncbi:MAG: hypothetical protein AAF530_21530 [Pseudomonadota bacterium]
MRKFPSIIIALFALAGCDQPNEDLMQQGLAKSGMAAAQASCYASSLAGAIDGDVYNQIAEALDGGASEKDAVNQARRKFGADFLTPLRDAKGGCTQ